MLPVAMALTDACRAVFEAPRLDRCGVGNLDPSVSTIPLHNAGILYINGDILGSTAGKVNANKCTTIGQCGTVPEGAIVYGERKV